MLLSSVRTVVTVVALCTVASVARMPSSQVATPVDFLYLANLMISDLSLTYGIRQDLRVKQITSPSPCLEDKYRGEAQSRSQF